MINETDRQILKILQENSRTTNAEIARQVGMAPSATLERIRKLEERGAIKGYAAQISGDAIGRGLLAFIFVRLEEMAGEGTAAQAMARLPEALEVHHVAGEDCFLVKVRAANTEALGRLLRDQISTIKGVRSTRTTIVLHTEKETTALVLDDESKSTSIK